tara:strand:- start:227 stop:775 length:549 start_codon:yes stop_codon:yes gene_type:complete
MGQYIPSKTESKRFIRQHPIVSLFLGFSLFSSGMLMVNSFNASRGNGPLSFPKAFGVNADVDDSLGATTSTSTSTSSSHPAIVRERMLDEANRYHAPGSGSMFGSQGFYGVSTTASSTTANVPPALRRRIAAGQQLDEVQGSHLGKQMLSEVDIGEDDAEVNAASMFGIAGMSPVMEGGWTE